MAIKIEKGVPLPRVERGATRKYPWHEMGVGESFVGDKNARSMISRVGYTTGYKFTSRKIGENEFRIWRVK